MTDTIELIERIKAGDTGAFRLLIEMYQRLVFNISYRMISNESEREDVCQEIFIKIYRNLSGFNNEAKLSTWIGRIAVNTCINALKKKKVPLFDDAPGEDVSIENSVSDKTAPDDYTERADLHIKLQQEINRLPHNYRSILTLYHIEDMSYKEISDILDLPAGTVKSYLFRARKMLKDRLTEKYQLEEIWHANA